jgi:hypothetical protein
VDSIGIILNVTPIGQKLTRSDMALLRETVRLAVAYDPADQSFRFN